MIRTLSDKLPDKGAQLHKQKAMVAERMVKMKRSVPKSSEEAAKILASITTTTTTGPKAPVSCAKEQTCILKWSTALYWYGYIALYI